LSCALLYAALAAIGLLDGGPVTPTRYEFEEGAMGVPMRVVLYARTPAEAECGARAAFDRIQRLNGILSDYDAASELRQMCAAATADRHVTVSDDLWQVLVQAARVSEATDGAFDITAGPVIRLWRQARALHRLPDGALLREALASIGYRHVVLGPEDRAVRLTLPDMRLDLGGIAKGYAMDQAIDALRQQGIASALVDAGGDIAVSGPPPGEKGWRIAIAGIGEDPPEYYLCIANAGVSTSGDRWQYTEIDGVRYSHIVDPRTGKALTGRRSVTVVGRRALLTDGWATALNVLGPDEGLAALAREPGVAAYCIYQDGDETRRAASDGWAALLRDGIVRREERR
jgi:FAD:protein FMN transferase